MKRDGAGLLFPLTNTFPIYLNFYRTKEPVYFLSENIYRRNSSHERKFVAIVYKS